MGWLFQFFSFSFGNEVKISGSPGEKNAKPSQKKWTEETKAERLVTEGLRGAGHRRTVPEGSCAVGTGVTRTWLCSLLSLSGF